MMPKETLQAILKSLIDERRDAAAQAALTATGDNRASISTTSAALVQALALEEAVLDLYEHNDAKQQYINKLVNRCDELQKRLEPELDLEAEALEAQEEAAAQEAAREWTPGRVDKAGLAEIYGPAFRDGWNACRVYHGMK